MVVTWQPNTIDDRYIVQYQLNGSVSYTMSDPVSACFIHSIVNYDKAQPCAVNYNVYTYHFIFVANEYGLFYECVSLYSACGECCAYMHAYMCAYMHACIHV